MTAQTLPTRHPAGKTTQTMVRSGTDWQNEAEIGAKLGYVDSTGQSNRGRGD
jgi:hypothetical protein